MDNNDKKLKTEILKRAENREELTVKSEESQEQLRITKDELRNDEDGNQEESKNTENAPATVAETTSDGGDSTTPPTNQTPSTTDETEEEDESDDDELLSYTPEYKAGVVIQRSIVDEMKSNYLDYSMSVIVARALPDVKDGLKPSQRRILVAMNDLGLNPAAHFRKSAKIAGDTSGNYHPHGEQVVYPTMVKLAQEFAMRYRLIDGQGNWGSIDGDTAAAMRYTEAKMTKITMEMIRDIEKGTVIFTPNYDATREEPVILPTLFPNLLCNGSDGIAVGMATKIPPHNLSEVVDALRDMIARGNKWEGKTLYNELRKKREAKTRTPRTLNATPFDYYENYLDPEDPDREAKIAEFEAQIKASEDTDSPVKLYPEFESDITTEDLIKIIPGPDFPTGGIIYDRKEIINAYATGRGRILARAKAAIEEGKNGRFQIIVTEIPYQVNKAHLVEAIADLVKDKRIEGIADIRDESNLEGMRIVVVLKKETQPKVVLNKLYKFTEMQKAFNANMISLVDGAPQTLNLKNILELFLSHRQTITIRRYEYDLAQARYRAHILEGLLKALDILDEIIATIRGSKTQEIAKTNLIEKYDFTEAQAVAILDMQLRKLAALEREKLQDEYNNINNNIAEWNRILESQEEILKVIDSDLAMLKEKYGDARKTKVVVGQVDDISEEDTVELTETFVTISRSGYIKRVPPDTYRLQKRGGKGVIGATTKEDDYIQHALVCSTHSDLMLFTNRGRAFSLKAYQIPESSRTAKGIPIVNLIQVEQGEIVTSLLNLYDKIQDKTLEGEEDSITPRLDPTTYKYLFMATKRGTVKKTEISDFSSIRASGLIAIKLESGDELKWVQPTDGTEDIMLVTSEGKSIRFNETDVRPTGRNTMGVTGMRFKSTTDEIISMDVIFTNHPNAKKGKLFTLSEKGFGKMTILTEYEAQKRAGSGVFTFRVKDKTGKLVVAKTLYDFDSEIVIISTKGQVIRAGLGGIPTLNRQTSGVKVMNMHDGDTVAAMATL